MNILLQSIKAVSLISILSVSCTFPMAWVGETIKQEGRRARWNFEVVKNSLPNHTGAYVAGALALTGLSALIYQQYNTANSISINSFASLADSVTPEAMPLLVSQAGTIGADRFIIGHDQKSTSADNRLEAPLHQAIRNGDIQIITQILSELKTGAQRQMAINKNKNTEGQSAIDLAINLGKFSIATLLSVELTKPDQI